MNTFPRLINADPARRQILELISSRPPTDCSNTDGTAPADEAARIDREWFAEHPDATRRVRPSIAGEFAPAIPRWTGWTVTIQMAEGFRVRFPLNSAVWS